jgi:type IV pilus assembly protein PilC
MKKNKAMPKFLYTAKHSSTGETKGGEMTAKDEKSLAQQLRAEGFLVTSVKAMEKSEEGVHVKFLDRFQSVPLKEKMIFARNLSVMVASGLTLSRAIGNLQAQVKSRYFKTILVRVNEDLQGGKTLSASLAQFPGVFSELFVNMVYVGEVSGNLDKVLDILAVQLEKEHDLLSKVRGALMYPAVVVTAMIGIGIIMLTYVLPKITGVFKDMDVQLPAATQFVIGISDFLRNHSVASLGIFVTAVVFLRIFLKTAPGKRALSYAVIHFPVISNIIVKVNCARFARIYSSLLKSGVSVVDSLSIVSRTLSNVYYKDALREGIAQIQKGADLSRIIASYPVIFPVLVPQMVEVGEETGKTEEVLEKLAEFYEGEVDQITKNLSSIIEPVLMLLIGGAVGFFAVAMLQPMYSVLENIK